MTIPCKAEDGWECPYKITCLARLNDPSIVGCGYPLYLNGVIDKGSIYVVHKISADVSESSKQTTRKTKHKINKTKLR